MSEQSKLKAAFDRVATNVAVITVADELGLHGCTANSWAESPEPPLLLITLRRGGSTHGRVVAAGRFAVNLLAEDQGELVRTFAGPGDRFSGLAHRLGDVLGQPLLPQAVASLECELEGRHDFGTYDILVGAVRSTTLRDVGDPLIYFDGSFRRLAVERL